MNSLLPSALSSLDESLTRFCGNLAELEAARAVDVDEVIEQVKKAAESADNLRSWIAAELPGASWESREELDAVVGQIHQKLEALRIEELRTYLVDLAGELERGTITHRRAVRVTELNQLREQAIEELLGQATSDAAPHLLPGPDPVQWVEWACGLKEPDDADSLRSLRSGFPRLDDFIANLEPGMWVVEPGAVTASERREQEARQLEERRSRLLALANELERGRIMHHRAFRVNQLNQLRDQAVTELRGKAEAEGPLQALPGPDANQWIAWATTLQEPDDAESLQMLRDGFERLDDFVANLEPDMWVPDGAASAPAAAIMEEPIAPQQSQPVPEPVEPPKISVAPMAVAPAPPAKSKAAKAAARAARAAARAEAAAAVATVTAVAEPTPAPVIHSFPAGPNGDVPLRSDADVPSTSPDNSDSPNSLNNMFSDHIQFKRPLNVHGDADEDESNPSFAATFKSRVEGLLRGRWQMLLVATSAVVLIALGLFLWRSHHNGEVKAAERSEPAKSTPAATTYDPSVVAAANAAQPPAGSAKSANEKDSKQKDQKDAKNQNNQKDQQKDQASEQNPSNETATKQASLLDDGGLRTPSAIPKNGAKKEEVAVNTPPPGMPGALPGAMPNGMASVVKDMPVAQPKISAQKVKVSSGVAQAMLVHQVPPEYPSQARQQGIQGTVVLQAVIGKDGSVRNVRAVSGNFLLRQAAVDAVKQWRYRPYSVDGEPVEADTQIDVKFRP